MDEQQYKACIQGFKNQVEKAPKLRKGFSKEELALIRAGHTPRNMIWHHEAEPGRIKLVKRSVHRRTAHTGGRSIWGRPNE